MRRGARGAAAVIMQGLVGPFPFPLSGCGIRRLPLADPVRNALSEGSPVCPRWGVYRHVLVSGDTAGCVFHATVHWGDGVIDHVAHIRRRPDDDAHLCRRGPLPTVHITGAGTPTSPDVFCTLTRIPSSPYGPTCNVRDRRAHTPRCLASLPSMYPDHLYAENGPLNRRAPCPCQTLNQRRVGDGREVWGKCVDLCMNKP